MKVIECLSGNEPNNEADLSAVPVFVHGRLGDGLLLPFVLFPAF
jgi:hypothetical protein